MQGDNVRPGVCASALRPPPCAHARTVPVHTLILASCADSIAVRCRGRSLCSSTTPTGSCAEASTTKSSPTTPSASFQPCMVASHAHANAGQSSRCFQYTPHSGRVHGRSTVRCASQSCRVRVFVYSALVFKTSHVHKRKQAHKTGGTCSVRERQNGINIEALSSKASTQCHQCGGMYNAWPAPMTCACASRRVSRRSCSSAEGQNLAHTHKFTRTHAHRYPPYIL